DVGSCLGRGGLRAPSVPGLRGSWRSPADDDGEQEEEQEERSHEGGTREQRESHAQEVVPEGITDGVLALGVGGVGQERVVGERHVSSVLYGRSSAMSGWSRQNSITLAMSTKLNPASLRAISVV